MRAKPLIALLAIFASAGASAQTRLLRQPTIAGDLIVFAYGGDLWSTTRAGGEARRLTATPAVESDPQLSPDGQLLAFSSNRDGVAAVYVMPSAGGAMKRLTWYPTASIARGWTPDGARVLYSTSRATAPSGYDRLWTVSAQGGPSTLLPAPWAQRGAYAADGKRMVIDRMSRWDVEWRNYRGGQNTALVLLDLDDLDEVQLPNERTTDIDPLWLGNTVYFISDRNRAANIWSYDVTSKALKQVTSFSNADVKTLSGSANTLVFEQDGYLHTHDVASGRTQRLNVTITGDFPWAAPRWTDAARGFIATAQLSPTGKRALMEARGDIFTIPADKGDARNLTRSSNAADRAPVWSPSGTQIAWFSDNGSGYALKIANQDGTGATRSIGIGDSKMVWNSTWSPDGKKIAFVDDKARVRVIDVASGEIATADTDGNTIARGGMGLTWSNDSRFLAYSKQFPNMLRRIVVWNAESKQARPVTDAMAHALSPAWDRDGRHLYFLGSTDLGLAAGWANTSSIGVQATYAPYLVVLRNDDPTPFGPQSDEEAVTPARPDTASTPLRVDFEGIEQRIVALPGVPTRRYSTMIAGPRGSVFFGEAVENQPGLVLHKFTIADRKLEVFARGVSRVTASADGRKLMYSSGPSWQVVDATRATAAPDAPRLNVVLRTYVEPAAEWQQIYDESWRYQKDFFYDPGTHGADWNAVKRRYEPLLAHVKHRADLNYVLDMVNGELSVGHSFVGGGDLPGVDTVRVGLLGADLEASEGRWRITRIFTSEVWNPGLSAPLAAPGLRVSAGNYILAIDGVELTANDDPYRLLDGTVNRQTVLTINTTPSMQGARTITVVPIASEAALRQRAWVEDNRRKVDELSAGKLAYIWVPNTGGPGVVSFNRYFFSQQDKLGAVVDERFNGGGNLDDFMVDMMNRSVRAGITNEAPGSQPMVVPAGVLGPKVLLINELAGSGGDYFPWAFRHLKIGPLIGTRTWGGLVRSCSHYPMLDGGSITSPCNAIFQPGGSWVAENEGVPPDIEVRMDAKAVAAGRDPQLERGVQEALRLLGNTDRRIIVPPFPRPAGWPRGGN